jgi:hypothetical protein
MQETPLEYTQRMLRILGDKRPLGILSSTPAKISRLMKGVSAASFKKQPAPSKWSAAQILAHVADSEIVVGYRIRSILGAPGTPIAAFDQDRWAETQNYVKRDPKLSLKVFGAVREANLALLKSIGEEQWKQFGVHAERGVESIEHISKMLAGHDLNHLGQLEILLKRSGK